MIVLSGSKRALITERGESAHCVSATVKRAMQTANRRLECDKPGDELIACKEGHPRLDRLCVDLIAGRLGAAFVNWRSYGL